MLVEIPLPRLGESIEEATILSILKNEGDRVEEGETIIEIATDKVDSDIVAPSSGIIDKIEVSVQDVVKIGTVLATIHLDNKSSTDKKDKSPSTKISQKKADHSRENAIPQKAPELRTKPTSSTLRTVPDADIFLSPLVLSIAKKENLSMEDIRLIEATGTDGRIRKSDIVRYLKNRKYPLRPGNPRANVSGDILANTSSYKPPKVEVVEGKDSILQMDRMREMIANHMVYSTNTAPHVTCYVEVDLTDIVDWRTRVKNDFFEKHNTKLTYTPIFIQAVAKAILDFPMINVSLQGKDIILKKDINIGMATALPSGNLIVPVIRNADKKSLVDLSKEVNALSQKARENNLSPDDIKGGTFTLSNVGTFGSLTGTPIINQPQSAILATGIIKKRAEVIERDGIDKIEIRQMMMLALSFDHRVIDGFLGGSFARKIADYLESFHQNNNI